MFSATEPAHPDDRGQVENAAYVQDLEGHATTDSSDSSGADSPAGAPVVSSYIVKISAEQTLVEKFQHKEISIVSL